ncbi:MAG: type II toxin-antitoxin system HicA family toxin [Defluviitaleaceae bacterium]|nr:type II toxin-antitoxin system HicA family toxin [Defluviitaleaceae bacterium]
MGDYTRKVKKILSNNGCYFVRRGKGDHNIWFSPITGKNFALDGKITSRISANEMMKEAGVKEKV